MARIFQIQDALLKNHYFKWDIFTGVLVGYICLPS